MSRRPDPEKQRLWLDLVLRWRRSGLSVRAFCGRHRLSQPSFYLWRRTLRQRGLLADEAGSAESAMAMPAFVQVAVDPESAFEASPAIELVLPQGCILRVRPRFDPELLRQLLALLQERPC